jgi:dihydroflavonol-4-reductase
MPLAYANEIIARFSGSEPFLNRESLRLSAKRMFFDDSKARRALGYDTRPTADAVADAVRWFAGRRG